MRVGRRRALRWSAAGMLVPALPALAACSDTGGGGDGGDELQVVENPVAATAADSPAATAEPEGTVLPLDEDVTAMAVHPGSRTLAVATADSVRLYRLDRLGGAGAKPRTVGLPGAPAKLTAAGGDLLAALPEAGILARIAVTGGDVTEVPVRGEPTAAAVLNGQTLVAVRQGKAVRVLEGDRVVATISGELYSADDVLVTGGGAFVLDRLRTALFRLDLAEGRVAEGLRAGFGATNAVVDRFERVLVTDTRRGGLLAFSTDPLLLRQRYPVPGAPYGIAYDSGRDLAWVTLTGRNEVVAYDVAGGEPKEAGRYPTVKQPNSVTVDERTSRVVIGSAAGEGIQVIAV